QAAVLGLRRARLRGAGAVAAGVGAATAAVLAGGARTAGHHAAAAVGDLAAVGGLGLARGGDAASRGLRVRGITTRRIARRVAAGGIGKVPSLGGGLVERAAAGGENQQRGAQDAFAKATRLGHAHRPTLPHSLIVRPGSACGTYRSLTKGKAHHS